jgi:hypothetical protein
MPIHVDDRPLVINEEYIPTTILGMSIVAVGSPTDGDTPADGEMDTTISGRSKNRCKECKEAELPSPCLTCRKKIICERDNMACTIFTHYVATGLIHDLKINRKASKHIYNTRVNLKNK